MNFKETDLLEIYPSIENYALSLTRNPDLARELTQQSVLKALENNDKFKEGTNLKAWMMTLMRNLFLNEKNKEKRVREKNEFLTKSESFNFGKTKEKSTPINDFYKNEIIDKIQKLSDELKKPLIMFANGFKYREISDELALPIGTIKSRIFVARNKLKDMIDDTFAMDY